MSQCILIIDDDDNTRDLLVLALQDASYQTIGHADHATAYERLREVHPDLVITHLMQGTEARGWHTLMAALLDPDTRDIPVLLMSSNSDYLWTNRQYLDEHGCGALEKPFTLEQLLAKVVATAGGAPASAG